jgi:elongation factor 2 kinase
VERAKTNYSFTHKDFHRKVSGHLLERATKSDHGNGEPKHLRASTIVRTVNSPVLPDTETRLNLGKVHYQLAVLHGQGRFPELVSVKAGDDPLNRPGHDVFSVLFHLSYAASFENAPACLALGRLQAGLASSVSDLLSGFLQTDFVASKHMLRRAMSSPQQVSRPKAAAGCLLYQILSDEKDVVDETEESHSSHVVIQVLEDTMALLEATEKEANETVRHHAKIEQGCIHMPGDRVNANYCLEGTYYPASVVSVSSDGTQITVKYEDDGTEETLSNENVRPLVPPTATQTTLGGPHSDEEVFGNDGDDGFLLNIFELQAELAELKAQSGDAATACQLYMKAADGAIKAGKMKSATQWSLRAAELES